MPRKRRRISQYFTRSQGDHLIQGTGQSIQDPTEPDETIEEEVEDILEETMDATDVATDGDTLPEHGVIDEVEAEISANPNEARKLMHRPRNRHFLPLQPGVISCR